MKSINNYLNTIYGILFLLFLTTCNDNTPATIYTITGYLYNDCSLQPITNQSLEILQDVANGTGATALRATTVTDSTGYFSLEFTVDNFNDQLIIQYPTVNHIITGIPPGEDIDSLVLLENPSCNFSVSLNVLNPYTADDELIISDYSDWIADTIQGPFVSGYLYTAVNFPLFEMTYGGSTLQIGWYVNNADTNYYTMDFTVYNCTDTVPVIVDIY